MEVRDIFALRKKEGKAEEAYRAISEIFATHQGPHTNLCMFWCASDLLRQRIKEKNAGEARRLLGQMVKVWPTIKDNDHRAARAISRAALDMDRLVTDFNLIYFLPWFRQLTDEDWQPQTIDGHRVPSLGQQIVNHLMRNIGERDAAYIEQVTDIFRLALQKQPVTPFIQRLQEQLSGVLPVSAADEQALYARSKAYVDKLICLN